MSKINKIQVDETTYDIEDLSVPSWAKQENKPTYSYSEIQNTPDLSNFITKEVDDLTYYELKTATGNSIAMSIDSSTYVLTISLKNSAGTILNTQTVDLPLETMVVGGSYDSTNKKIILTLKNGQTIDVPVGDLVSGLQSEITSQNKLLSDLVDDTNQTNKFVSTSEKSTWNAKYDKPSGGIPDTDLSSAVQTSLGKADTALQSETYTGTITSVKMNGSTIATSGEADLGTVLTQHQDISGKQDIIQYSTMPTASASTVGKVVQFTGTTDSTYTNGYFYIGIDTSGVYSWEQLEVQPSGSQDNLIVDTFENSSGYGTFVFGDKKPGIYFVSTPTNNLDGYKKFSSSTKQYFSMYSVGIKPIIIIYSKDVNDIGTPSSNTYFAYMIGFFTRQNTASIIYQRLYIDTNGDIQHTDSSVPYTFLSDTTQAISGKKIFGTIPEVSSYSAPTTNTQLTAKKYVDDQLSSAIGNINTILATLTTPQGGE